MVKDNIVVFANLKAIKLNGSLSDGIILTAIKNGKPSLIHPDPNCPIGAKLVLEDHPHDHVDVKAWNEKLDAEKQVERKVFRLLKINAEGLLTYNGERVAAKDEDGNLYEINTGQSGIHNADVS